MRRQIFTQAPALPSVVGALMVKTPILHTATQQEQLIRFLVNKVSTSSCLHYKEQQHLFSYLLPPTTHLVGARDSPIQLVDDTQPLLFHFDAPFQPKILHLFTVLNIWRANINCSRRELLFPDRSIFSANKKHEHQPHRQKSENKLI